MIERGTSNIRVIDPRGDFYFSSQNGVEGFNKAVLAGALLFRPIFLPEFSLARIERHSEALGLLPDVHFQSPEFEALVFPYRGNEGTVAYRDFFGSQTDLRFLEARGVHIIPYTTRAERNDLCMQLRPETLITSSALL